MAAGNSAQLAAQERTKIERTSDRELIVTRRFNGPARIVFEAWTKPELFQRWWAPKSFGITFVSCELDVRTGGTYRFKFAHPDFKEPMEFFGKYIEVVPNSRIVWTNEEDHGGGSVTTATFSEKGGETLLVISDVYPSKEALDSALASESTGAFPEQFEALDAVLAGLSKSPG